jgi:very-short-patch-repair endonuclease
MDTNRDDVRRLAAAQGAAFSAAQARASGVSHHELYGTVRDGEWVRRARGLLVVAGAPPTWHQDLQVALLAAGDRAVVSGHPALEVHGFRRCRKGLVEVMVPFGVGHTAPFGRLRQTRWLPDTDIVVIDGLRVTSVARTVFDVIGEPGHPLAFRREPLRGAHNHASKLLIDEGMRRHGLTMGDLARMLVVHGRRGVAGTSIIREIVKELGLEYRPTDTELENTVLELIVSRGIEAPEHQVDISDHTGWLGRVDFFYRLLRLIIEVDGPDHDTPLQQALDALRDAAMRAAGYEVLRIHWTLVFGDPRAVVKKVLAATTAVL